MCRDLVVLAVLVACLYSFANCQQEQQQVNSTTTTITTTSSSSFHQPCRDPVQIRCPNGRCVSELVYRRTGCQDCDPEHERRCPDGSCVSRKNYDAATSTATHCPPPPPPQCAPDEKRCSDGQCIERNDTCASCIEGERRCATGECINVTTTPNEHCRAPCFHFEVVCKDRTCRSHLAECPCLPPNDYRCEDGNCRADWHQCSEGKTFMIWYILGSSVFITVGIIAVYYGSQRRRQQRGRRHHSLHSHLEEDDDLLTGSLLTGHYYNPGGVLLDSERQHIVYQSVPSHYPVPVGVDGPEPVIHGSLEDLGEDGDDGSRIEQHGTLTDHH